MQTVTNLLTKAERANIPKLYDTEDVEPEDKVIQVKFFTPWSNWTWYIIEFDGHDRCFGYVKGLDSEFGYFSLKELSELEGPFGLKVERDKFFSPTKVCDIPGW